MTKKPTIKSLQKELAIANDALEMALALSPETDNTFFTGGLSGNYTDRNSWDRKKIFAESLRAWRVSPIARRIVRLTRSFIIGKGLEIKCDDDQTQAFLEAWSEDRLNKLNKNFGRWKDEDTRTGNLFILFNVAENGMTYLRAVPAEQIEEIIATENDIEQPIRFNKDATSTDFYEAYNPDAQQTSFMLHFASNRPVGSQWGEGDLPPLLAWIGRFSTWLEDRVRLNHFRNIIMYIIEGSYASETERYNREKTVNANPPKPGSVLVVNKNNGEKWGILSPTLDSFDASVDGQAIKRNILSGVGFPMHWFAEPEGSTRTTAEAAGTPTFRTLEEEQDNFFEIVIELAQTAVNVRSRYDKSVNPKAKIWIEGPDITERDNAALALALGRSYPHLADLFDRDAIDAKEFMKQVYKTFAEIWTGKTPNIKKKPLTKAAETAPLKPQESENTQ